MNEQDMSATQEENQQMEQGQETCETIHTAAEAALLETVNQLRQEVATLREENRKLFLRIGGENKPEETADEAIMRMLKDFRAVGYDPSKLIEV